VQILEDSSSLVRPSEGQGSPCEQIHRVASVNRASSTVGLVPGGSLPKDTHTTDKPTHTPQTNRLA